MLDQAEFEILLKQLGEVMTDGTEEQSVLAETYHDILTREYALLSRFDPDVFEGPFDPEQDDVEGLINDTIGRAFMFLELAAHGEMDYLGMPIGSKGR